MIYKTCFVIIISQCHHAYYSGLFANFFALMHTTAIVCTEINDQHNNVFVHVLVVKFMTNTCNKIEFYDCGVVFRVRINRSFE